MTHPILFSQLLYFIRLPERYQDTGKLEMLAKLPVFLRWLPEKRVALVTNQRVA
jgi:hypothetical protein